jgi:pimeloyl-ACP methyl ester carboxylesterase
MLPADLSRCAEFIVESYHHQRPWFFRVGDTFYVVLKGTVNTHEWYIDGVCELVDWPGHPKAKVHKGFFSLYQLIAHPVETAIMLNCPPKIVVVGHSLGAGLATMLGLELKTAGYDVEVVTFGSPRVGNRAFTKLFNSAFSTSSTRVVLANDAVPHLPPKWFKWVNWKYRHVNKRLWLDHDGAKMTTSSNVLKRLARLISWVWTARHDHNENEYAAALRAYASTYGSHPFDH